MLTVQVMECGEIDFAALLDEQRAKPLNMSFVGLYWQQVRVLTGMTLTGRCSKPSKPFTPRTWFTPISSQQTLCSLKVA